MKLEDIFKAENLPPAYPMSSPEGQWQFVQGQSRTSGNFAIDIASGVWGFPTDRIIEVFGEESTGKTTIAIQKCAVENEIGRKAFYIDVEHSLDWQYAQDLGVKSHLFYVEQPMSAEEAIKLLMNACKAEDVGVVVLDSVAALATQAMIDGEVGDHHIAQVARLMSTYMSQINAICSVNETLAIFLNQNRVNPGAYGAVYQPGGRALRFYASQRISLRKVSTDGKGDEAKSNEVEITFRKNKLAAPFRVAKFDLIFGRGANNGKTILEEALKREVVTKKGSWIVYKGNQIGQGINACAEILEAQESKTIREEIVAQIKEKETKPKIKKKASSVAGVSKVTEGFTSKTKMSLVSEDGDED